MITRRQGKDNHKKPFSIIIPVLHEAPEINHLLGHLRTLEFAPQSELIVVDGSDSEDTLQAIADSRDILCLASRAGRASQMNAGAAVAAGDILVFLHADTLLPADALTRIGQTLEGSICMGGGFKLGIRSRKWRYRIIAAMASIRSRLTRIPYGDQAIFIRNDDFRRLGGYPEIPLMEDVALMRRIKKAGCKICIIPRCVSTSPRRWEREGVLYTTLRNWFLLTAYYLGISPEKLARYYKSGGDKDGKPVKSQ